MASFLKGPYRGRAGAGATVCTVPSDRL